MAALSSCGAEGFAGSDSFPHFWESGHVSSAISSSESSGWPVSSVAEIQVSS